MNIAEKSNEFATNIVVMVHKPQLDALQMSLEDYGIYPYAYSLMKDADNAACLTFRDGIWAVYVSERGAEHDLKTFQCFREAGEEFLNRLSSSKEMYGELLKLYHAHLDAQEEREDHSVFNYIKQEAIKFASTVAVL